MINLVVLRNMDINITCFMSNCLGMTLEKHNAGGHYMEMGSWEVDFRQSKDTQKAH